MGNFRQKKITIYAQNSNWITSVRNPKLYINCINSIPKNNKLTNIIYNKKIKKKLA